MSQNRLIDRQGLNTFLRLHQSHRVKICKFVKEPRVMSPDTSLPKLGVIPSMQPAYPFSYQHRGLPSIIPG